MKKYQKPGLGKQLCMLSLFAVGLTTALSLWLPVRFLNSTSTEVQNNPFSHLPESERLFPYQSIGTISKPTPRPAAKQLYTVEVAVVDTQEKAEQLIASLEKQQIEGYYTPFRRGHQVRYHVRVGTFTRKSHAEGQKKKLKQAQRSGAQVLRL